MEQFVGQMVEPFGHSQLQSGFQDEPGQTGYALRGLAQVLKAGVGEQGMVTSGLLEAMGNKAGRSVRAR